MIYKLVFVWNIITFILMGVDKWKAIHHRYRIKEMTLLRIAFLFGSFGIGLAMFVFHHKIRKRKFILFIPCFILVQALSLIFI